MRGSTPGRELALYARDVGMNPATAWEHGSLTAGRMDKAEIIRDAERIIAAGAFDDDALPASARGAVGVLTDVELSIARQLDMDLTPEYVNRIVAARAQASASSTGVASDAVLADVARCSGLTVDAFLARDWSGSREKWAAAYAKVRDDGASSTPAETEAALAKAFGYTDIAAYRAAFSARSN